MSPQPMSTLMPRVNAGREERADAGEGHLAERQLPRPAGEDRERQAAQGEHEDRRVQQVPRRLGDDERQDDRGDRRARSGRSGRAGGPTSDRAAAAGIGRRFGANENVWVSRGALRLWKYTATSTPRSRRKSIRPGWSRKLKPIERLQDPDGDAGDEGPRERHHAGDHRGGERAHQRARPERREVRSPSRTGPPSARSRSSTARRRRPTRTSTPASG